MIISTHVEKVWHNYVLRFYFHPHLSDTETLYGTLPTTLSLVQKILMRLLFLEYARASSSSIPLTTIHYPDLLIPSVSTKSMQIHNHPLVPILGTHALYWPKSDWIFWILIAHPNLSWSDPPFFGILTTHGTNNSILGLLCTLIGRESPYLH
jgi:hypothetical protein